MYKQTPSGEVRLGATSGVLYETSKAVRLGETSGEVRLGETSGDFGGEVRLGATSGVLNETSKARHVAPRLHRE